MSGWAWWLVGAGMLAAAEMVTLTIFFGMLAIAALVGAGVAALGAPLPVQMLIALGSTLPLLGLARPRTLKYLHRDTPDLVTGTAGYIGRSALVSVPIAPHRPGQVSLLGELWPAVADDPDQAIAVGAKVTITDLRGSTLTVRPS